MSDGERDQDQPAEADEDGAEVQDESRAVSGIGDLLRAALDVTDELAAVWSAGLDRDSESKAIREYKRRVGQTLHQVQQWADRVSERLAERDLDRLRTNFPLELADVGSLSIVPAGDQQINQLWLALFYVLRDASQAFGAIGAEDARRANAHDGERLGSFWEAGSFGLLRQRVLAVADVVDRFSLVLADRAAEFELSPSDVSPPLANDAATRAFERAQALVALGFHDAALPLLLEAFDEGVRAVIDPAEGEQRIVVGLNPPLGVAVRMLRDATSQMAHGIGVVPEVAVPLADFFAGLLPELNIVPPKAPSELEGPGPESSDAASDARDEGLTE